MLKTETNHWLDESCARAFWDQHKALPYQELLHDTARWLDPKPGESWLDLGCGCGQLTGILWQLSQGKVRSITSTDCAAVNDEAIAKLRLKLKPAATPEQIRFMACNFSDGLPQFGDGAFDGIVSGLAISYAESRDADTGEYTDAAYNHLLEEMGRVLKPHGRMVFSVNVPDPKFWSIFWKSLGKGVQLSKPGRVLLNALKMQSHGKWLRQEARRGRFHFFSFPEINNRLQKAGFTSIRCRLTYASQAYVIYAQKAAVALREAA